MSSGIALRAPSYGRFEVDTPNRIVWGERNRRFGPSVISLTRRTGPAPSLPESARLANGVTVNYRSSTARPESRVTVTTLDGAFDLDDTRWTVHCETSGESENPPSATWCLRVLASARRVEPKP